MTGLVERILAILRAHPNTIRAEVAGSYRRCMETVGDLDFIVASESASELMELFVALEGVKEVTAKGITKSSVRFESGIQT